MPAVALTTLRLSPQRPYWLPPPCTSLLPIANCTLQAYQGVRIIDSHGDTFRADNARREAPAMAVSRVE